MRSFLFLIAIPIIAVLGYGVMHELVLIAPMASGNRMLYFLVFAAIIALGLLVPFWMLKSGFHSARIRDPREKELHLKDMPKDHEQIIRR